MNRQFGFQSGDCHRFGEDDHRLLPRDRIIRPEGAVLKTARQIVRIGSANRAAVPIRFLYIREDASSVLRGWSPNAMVVTVWLSLMFVVAFPACSTLPFTRTSTAIAVGSEVEGVGG